MWSNSLNLVFVYLFTWTFFSFFSVLYDGSLFKSIRFHTFETNRNSWIRLVKLGKNWRKKNPTKKKFISINAPFLFVSSKDSFVVLAVLHAQYKSKPSLIMHIKTARKIWLLKLPNWWSIKTEKKERKKKKLPNTD